MYSIPWTVRDEDGADLSSSTDTESSYSLSDETGVVQAMDSLGEQKITKDREKSPYQYLQIYRPGKPFFAAFSFESRSSSYSWIRTSLIDHLQIEPAPIDHLVREKFGDLHLQSIGIVNLQIRPHRCSSFRPTQLFHVSENPDIPDIILGGWNLRQVGMYRTMSGILQRHRIEQTSGEVPPGRPSTGQHPSQSYLDPISMSTPMTRGSSLIPTVFSNNQHPRASLSSSSLPSRPQPSETFTVAIICALAREFDAVEASFDEHYRGISTETHRADPNFYRAGRIGAFNVVLTCLSEMGKETAASATSSLRVSFPNLNLALVVGVCGGVPFPTENTEVVLGDVIISHWVAKFDFGRQYPDRFEPKGGIQDTLDRSDGAIRSLLAGLQTRRTRDQFQERNLRYLRTLQAANPAWQYPGVKYDRLFPASYRHLSGGEQGSKNDCENVGCSAETVQRHRLTTGRDPWPYLHIGPMASADTVMKSAEHRDELFQKMQIIGFEMEGAGVCESISCLILKGVCDYADSHKSKVWQDYAAASAASCAKAFMEYLEEMKYQCKSRKTAHCY